MSPSCFVAKIDLNLADKLRSALLEQGFSLSTPPYTLFSGKKTGVSCTLYESGKLTVQGKDKHDFITFYLEPEILGTLTYSYPELGVDMTAHIGMDEAGKGDFFGPLCVCSFYADESGIKELLNLGIKDSKRMNDNTIAKLAKKLQKFPHSIVRLPPSTYNDLYSKFQNLNRMLAWAHSKALEQLLAEVDCKNALVDQFGNESLMNNAIKQKHIDINLSQRTKAEDDPVVAAASVLARHAFVEGIDRLSSILEIELPKGASSRVIQVGKQIARRFGKEKLREFGKTHFKTYQDILTTEL